MERYFRHLYLRGFIVDEEKEEEHSDVKISFHSLSTWITPKVRNFTIEEYIRDSGQMWNTNSLNGGKLNHKMTSSLKTDYPLLSLLPGQHCYKAC